MRTISFIILAFLTASLFARPFAADNWLANTDSINTNLTLVNAGFCATEHLFKGSSGVLKELDFQKEINSKPNNPSPNIKNWIDKLVRRLFLFVNLENHYKIRLGPFCWHIN